MTNSYIPTDQELDALLAQQPQFDLNVVKRRTLSRISKVENPPSKKRKTLRCLLIAAVICALSVSTLAADYAMGGPITRTLGLPKKQETPEPPPVEEPAPTPAPLPEPVPEPEPAPVPEPPELDPQMAQALQISEFQAQILRPAIQKVEQTAEDQDVRMTVLQTLGDPYCLYVKLRFDFPEATPADEALEFDEMDFSLEGADGYRWDWAVLERDPQSITYLLHARLSGGESLNGLTATVTVKDYGTPHQYTEDEVIHLAGEAGVPYTTILYPDGTTRQNPTESELATLPPESTSLIAYSNGFTVSRREDGSKVVTYDGEHGDQLLEDFCLVPDFDTVIRGRWEQSWTISYQDLSRYWEGSEVLSDSRITLTNLRLSPLSWDMQFTIRELAGEEVGYGLLYGRDLPVQLRHRDGTLTDLPATRPTSGSLEQEENSDSIITFVQQGTSFEQPIDLTDITAFVIDGREIPIQ